jgi:hypothetical protein
MPAQLAVLLAALRHPDTRIYLHVDRRTRFSPFRRELSRGGVDDLDLLPRRDSKWGGLGMVDAALDGLRRALSDDCDYFVLLSGQDFPVWPVSEVIRFFDHRAERSYLGYFALPDSRWAYGGRMRTDFYSYDVLGRRETCFPKGEEPRLSFKGRMLNRFLRIRTAPKPARRFPPYLRPFGGSQWWNLNREAAEFVVRFTDEHPDYRDYHRHTLAPDEIFFHSILLGTSFGEVHEVVNDSLRFMIWSRKSWHPDTLRSSDLPAITRSGKPFARKFDLDRDPSVIEKLSA